MLLTDKCFLVTGASRGIGRAITVALLELGARVVGIARNWNGVPEHSGLQPVVLDLGEVQQLTQRLVPLVRDLSRLDGVICNAGAGHFGDLEQYSPARIIQGVELNLTQHLLVARACIPRLRRQGSGHLLFMGSESALQGGTKGAVYSACKFGLRGLAQSLRKDLARAGVAVTLINPGMVRTPFFEGQYFRPGPAEHHALQATDVARWVIEVLKTPPRLVIDEINLSPRQTVIDFSTP